MPVHHLFKLLDSDTCWDMAKEHLCKQISYHRNVHALIFVPLWSLELWLYFGLSRNEMVILENRCPCWTWCFISVLANEYFYTHRSGSSCTHVHQDRHILRTRGQTANATLWVRLRIFASGLFSAGQRAHRPPARLLQTVGNVHSGVGSFSV